MNYELDEFYWYDSKTFPKNLNVKKPTQFPCIILDLFTQWNDFGIVNNFFCFYFKNKDEPEVYLGKIKIISKNNNANNCILDLPKNFQHLPDDFVSIGCSHDYYKNLRDNLSVECFEICKDLRDVAINEDLRKDFERNYFWTRSIIRDNEAERMLRAAKDILSRNDFYLKHKFKYEYNFNKFLSDNKCIINFDFNVKNKYFPKRLYTIIGKNGVGKTTLIKHLIEDYINNESSCFSDSLPIFSKLILVTTSFLDLYSFTDEEKSKFVQCNFLGENNELLKENEQIDTIKKYLKEINDIDYEDNPISRNAIEVICKIVGLNQEDIQEQKGNEIKINTEKIQEIYKKSSSGIKSLLFIIISILANIRTDSLLLIDEPELHLHPNFIALFIYTIYKLLDNYSSYAIITTHSPIVIREMKADDVYIMDRLNNECSIRQTKIETLGAELSEITDEVFKTKDIPLHFEEIINEMKDNNCSKEEIIQTIKSKNRELSLAVELYIESLFDEGDIYVEYFN